MPYTRTPWANYCPPPLDAANLLNMEDGIWYGLAHSGGIRNTAEFLDRNPASTTGGLAEAIADLAGSPGVVFVAPHNHPIDVNYTIPANVHLIAGRGAIFTIANGIILTWALGSSFEGDLSPHFIGAGIIAGSPSCEQFYPEWFGVVGDYTTDDSTALQRALLARAACKKNLYFSSNLSIRVTKNLYVPGYGDLIGENISAEVVLDADLDLADGAWLWWGFGIPSKDGTPDTFIGRVKNLQIRLTSIARATTVFSFQNAEDFGVETCFFDFTAVPQGIVVSGVRGSNNSAWCDIPLRKKGRLLNNVLIADQDQNGGEGLGFSSDGVGDEDDIWFIGNYIYGFGDDPIGCHGLRKFVIEDNHCYSVDGRILFNNCTDGRICKNYAERIPYNGTWVGGGALMYGGIESATQEAPSRLIITENELYLPTDIPVTTYAMRLLGVRDAIVNENIIRCDTPNGFAYGILVQNDTNVGGWVDPTGIDPNGNARPRNITINDNRMCGDHPQGIGQAGAAVDLPGPFYVADNAASVYRWYTHTNFGLNSVVGVVANPMEIDEVAAAACRQLYEGYAPNIPQGGNVHFERQGGVTILNFWFEAPTRFIYLDVVLSEAITAGAIGIRPYLNDVLQPVWYSLTAADGLSVRVPVLYTDAWATLGIGDRLRFRAFATGALLPDGPIDIIIAVNGFSW